MISITIDDKQVRKAFAAAPALLAQELQREIAAYINGGSSDFSKARLRAPDDRRKNDFLLRRPPKSPGLRRATGRLGAAWWRKVNPPTTNIAEIGGAVGFLNDKAGRIARVHELGTVRYGGKLPDIVPKRAKYLAIPLRGAKVSRGTKVTAVVKLKKVGIPPRLGFVAWWTSSARMNELRKRAGMAARRALSKAARRG